MSHVRCSVRQLPVGARLDRKEDMAPEPNRNKIWVLDAWFVGSVQLGTDPFLNSRWSDVGAQVDLRRTTPM